MLRSDIGRADEDAQDRNPILNAYPLPWRRDGHSERIWRDAEGAVVPRAIIQRLESYAIPMMHAIIDQLETGNFYGQRQMRSAVVDLMRRALGPSTPALCRGVADDGQRCRTLTDNMSELCMAHLRPLAEHAIDGERDLDGHTDQTVLGWVLAHKDDDMHWED